MRLLDRVVRRVVPRRELDCAHTKGESGAWLTQHVPSGAWTPPICRDADVIAKRIALTRRGEQPLWDGYARLRGYARSGMTRSAREVGTSGPIGNLLAWLAQERPGVILEIGTAFGYSGMHWLSGLKAARVGELLTFEPNGLWAAQARDNLSAVGGPFTLVTGTFEANVWVIAGRKVDIAMIDAIHTSEFVLPEFDLVVEHASPGALVVIDDIDFSEDMRACWNMLVENPRVRAAVDLGRSGVIELR